jgi:hypothetical protein
LTVRKQHLIGHIILNIHDYFMKTVVSLYVVSF